MDVDIIVTCEHAGNNIPEYYRYLFPEGSDETLASHRGWDPGAWDVATYVADRLNASLYGCHTSRLLIEVNRSLHHPELFSEYTTSLDKETKERLLQEVYRPYREAVLERMKNSTSPVFHLSVHSFTPVWHGEVRAMDVGLLFDPERPWEASCCDFIRAYLMRTLPQVHVVFNEPYKGIDDGFTTSLRQSFSSGGYAGIEIELNQKLIGTPLWEKIAETLVGSVRDFRDLPANP